MSNPERSFSESHQAFSYQEYRSCGGQLKENFFSQAVNFLKNGQELRKRQKIYGELGRHYAFQAGITPSSQQENLYAFLREIMPLSFGEESKKGGDGAFPWQLSDQPLLADVFLLTNDFFSYQRFTAHFPYIFKEEGESK